MGNSNSSAIEQTWFHVVRVRTGSPAYEAQVEPFFDFITKAIPLNDNNELMTIDSDDQPSLQSIIDSHIGKRILLNIWSSKRQEFRG